MKKNRLIFVLIFALTVFLGISVSSFTDANAASKPAAKKKKVTLTTASDPYTMKIKNLAEDATVTFKSSNKKIITVNKKTGVVKPVAEGKASVKATVKQNGKTYKVKTTFTVKKAEGPTAKEYKEMAAAMIKELDKNAEVFDAKLDPSSFKLISSQDVLDAYVFNECKQWARFYLYVSDLNLLRSTEEYMAKYPAITSISFSGVKKYKNVIVVTVDAVPATSLYDDEYAIDCVIANQDTSLLSSDELKLYKQLSSLAKELKGKDDYTTVKNIHDQIILNTAYPASFSGDSVHTVNYTLNEGIAVCDGYAKTFYFLCKMNGIDCIMVTGTATNSNGKTEAHAWNKVKINDKWYAVDVTWDDPYPDEKGRVLYNYFLLADEDMDKNHTTSLKNLPEATSKDLGIVYQEYKDTPSFDTTSEIDKYMSSRIDEVLGAKYDLTFTFLFTGNSDEGSETVKDVLYRYSNKYLCGFNMKSEGAGTMGTKFEVRVYKG